MYIISLYVSLFYVHISE